MRAAGLDRRQTLPSAGSAAEACGCVCSAPNETAHRPPLGLLCSPRRRPPWAEAPAPTTRARGRSRGNEGGSRRTEALARAKARRGAPRERPATRAQRTRGVREEALGRGGGRCGELVGAAASEVAPASRPATREGLAPFSTHGAEVPGLRGGCLKTAGPLGLRRRATAPSSRSWRLALL